MVTRTWSQNNRENYKEMSREPAKLVWDCVQRIGACRWEDFFFKLFIEEQWQGKESIVRLYTKWDEFSEQTHPCNQCLNQDM